MWDSYMSRRAHLGGQNEPDGGVARHSLDQAGTSLSLGGTTDMGSFRVPLLVLWFLVITSASLWLPAYNGDLGERDLGGEAPISLPVYAALAGLAALAIRARAPTRREALLSALPSVGILGTAAIAGLLLNNTGQDYRGEPIYLYFGIALWTSWAVLMVATALASRTKWDGLAGICLGFVVAFLGLFLFTIQID